MRRRRCVGGCREQPSPRDGRTPLALLSRKRGLRRKRRVRGNRRLRREGIRSRAGDRLGDVVGTGATPHVPPAPAPALARDSRFVAFHGSAHRVNGPGVLLDFPDRIVITHASRRLGDDHVDGGRTAPASCALSSPTTGGHRTSDQTTRLIPRRARCVTK